MVDLPEPDRPVNQIVKPRCFRSSWRSWRVREGCHVIFLLRIYQIGGNVYRLDLEHDGDVTAGNYDAG